MHAVHNLGRYQTFHPAPVHDMMMCRAPTRRAPIFVLMQSAQQSSSSFCLPRHIGTQVSKNSSTFRLRKAMICSATEESELCNEGLDPPPPFRLFSKHTHCPEVLHPFHLDPKIYTFKGILAVAVSNRSRYLYHFTVQPAGGLR